MAEYKIGDRIRVKAYEDIPVEHRNKGKARSCGEIGTITDKLYSESSVEVVYQVKFDDNDQPSRVLWHYDCFDRYLEPTTEYSYEFEYLDNVVVARFYEVNGDEKTEIARGHGHIIHEGALGIAQASSYALKRILEKLNGGTIVTNTQNTWHPLSRRGGDHYDCD